MAGVRLLVLMALCQLTVADMWCLSDSSRPVDWWIIYKQPSGSQYYYFDSDTAADGWKLAPISLNDPKSPLEVTLSQMKSAAAFLFYNDQTPGRKRSSGNYGHAKGVLGFLDNGNGVWIMHSIPKFPAVDKKTGATEPIEESHLEYGQMAVCLSLNRTGMAEATEQVRYVQPLIYAKRGSSSDGALNELSETARSLWNRRPKWVRYPPYTREVSLKPRGGSDAVRAYGKSRKLRVDLYGSVLAPNTGSLLVESWRRGRGTKLPSNCSNVVTEVLNVHDVALEPTWRTTMDHSKWATSGPGGATYACVGDLNRMRSQFRRGGGAICFHSPAVSKAFRAAVKDVEPCPRN